MEDPTPYTNATKGLYWKGHLLFYHDLVIARVNYVERFFGKNYWNVRYDLPFSIELTDIDSASTFIQVQKHVQHIAQTMINKIKSYD